MDTTHPHGDGQLRSLSHQIELAEQSALHLKAHARDDAEVERIERHLDVLAGLRGYVREHSG